MKTQELSQLVDRAKFLRKKMESGHLSKGQLYELYGIYSILVKHLLVCRTSDFSI